MVPEEDPATDGGGDDGGTGPPEDGPQMGQEDQGTGALEETDMALDHQEGLGAVEHSGAVQEPPIGLPTLERRRQLDVVATVAHISLLARALGGITSRRESPQTDQGKSPQRSERQGSQQEGSGQPAPQAELGQRSDSQDFIPLSFAQAQSGEEPEAGEIPLSREQMRRAGMLLQERVTQKQRQQRAAPARHQTAITEELSTERQARQLAERRIAELEAQMARMRPPAQELGRQYAPRGQQTVPMIPRPLQVGASGPWQPMGTRQTGPPQMATRAMPPQMAAPTYAQVAQGPPRQALPRSAEEIRRWQEITRDKRAAVAPQAAGASRAAPRAQAPSPATSDLQAGQAVPGTSQLSADL